MSKHFPYSSTTKKGVAVDSVCIAWNLKRKALQIQEKDITMPSKKSLSKVQNRSLTANNTTAQISLKQINRKEPKKRKVTQIASLMMFAQGLLHFQGEWCSDHLVGSNVMQMVPPSQRVASAGGKWLLPGKPWRGQAPIYTVHAYSER